MTFTHVIWDWNGTLLDDRALCVDIMNGLLAPRGLPPIGDEFYQAIIEFPVQLYYERLGFDFTKEPFEAISDQYIAAYQAGWRRLGLQEGTMETLAALRALGIGQSILSASKVAHLHEQVDHFGLMPLMQRVTGVDDHHGRGKAHRAAEHLAALPPHGGALGIPAQSTVLVGDTLHDAEVARACGIGCILVSFGHYNHVRLQSAGMPVADSMSEIIAMLTSKSFYRQCFASNKMCGEHDECENPKHI